MTQNGKPLAEYEDHLATSAFPPSYSQASGEAPLWRWMLRDIGNRTVGVARVDLVRPRMPAVGEGGSIWSADGSDDMVGYPRVQGGSAYGRMQRPEYSMGGNSRGRARDQGGLLGYSAARGARLKVTRSIQFGKTSRSAPLMPLINDGEMSSISSSSRSSSPSSRLMGPLKEQSQTMGPWGGAQGLQPALLSFGAGLNFELDSMDLAFQTRVKFQDWFTLKLTPIPAIKIQKSIRLGSSPVSLRVRYEVPLVCLDEPFRPPARLLIKLENHIGAGVKLGTTGVDFDQRLISLGPNAAVRFAGAATFPRQIPVPRGEKMLDWQFDRLGLKTRW